MVDKKQSVNITYKLLDGLNTDLSGLSLLNYEPVSIEYKPLFPENSKPKSTSTPVDVILDNLRNSYKK